MFVCQIRIALMFHVNPEQNNYLRWCMYWLSALQKIFSVILSIVIVSAFSLNECHYLFSNHPNSEHCENHLHSNPEHHNCLLCKINLLPTVFEKANRDANVCSVAIVPFTTNFQSAVLYAKRTAQLLRGPPQG